MTCKKNSKEVEVFKKNFFDKIKSIKETSSKLIKIWFQDESRFGLRSIIRRRLTLKGVKSIGQKMEGFENFYIYGLISPSGGETYFWEFNSVNKDCFNAFMEKFNEEYSDYNNIIILDNASFHKGKELCNLKNTTLMFQPPYSPEVNGAGVWKEIKDKLGWLVFETLDDLRKKVFNIILNIDKNSYRPLTNCPYLLL